MYKLYFRSFVTLCLPILLINIVSADTPLIQELDRLKPLVGKTWKGEFIDSTPENPKFDVSRWERALNGTAVRILHSVNDGAYGGETMIYWDAEKDSLSFFYFTTAGFYTQGTMYFERNKFISLEKVTGNKNGITKVMSVGSLSPEGKMTSESLYFQNGQWIDGHTIIYTEDPNAKVVFK